MRGWSVRCARSEPLLRGYVHVTVGTVVALHAPACAHELPSLFAMSTSLVGHPRG